MEKGWRYAELAWRSWPICKVLASASEVEGDPIVMVPTESVSG